MKKIFLFFIFSFINIGNIFAENLNFSEKNLIENNLITIGTFTTGDIKQGTITSLQFDGRDNSSSSTGYIKLFINTKEIFFDSVSVSGTTDWVNKFSSNFALEPNTTYTITGQAYYRAGFIKNISIGTQIYNTKPSIGEITTNVESINIENGGNVGFTLNNILDLDQVDNLSFKYSFDNINYILLDGVLSGPITSGIYSFNLDLFDKPNGIVIIYIKANDGLADSDSVSISLVKNTDIPEPETDINIVNVDSEFGIKKVIFTTDYGDIYYNINKEGKCNNTLTFLLLEGDIDFKYGSDNGKFICYKVKFGKGQEIYKLSNKITGIEGIMEYSRGDTFGGFKNWKSSRLVREGDNTLAFLKMMTSTDSTNVKSYPSNLIDINGDGLIDMLYSNFSNRKETRFTDGRVYDYYITSYKYAIMINNGDYSFKPVYRCVYEDGKYYGNCVDLAEIEN